VVAYYFTAQQLQLLRQHVRRGRNVYVVWSGDKAGELSLREVGAQVVRIDLSQAEGEVASYANVAR
jgi:hypothetical protein